MPRFDVWVAAKSEILPIEDDDENEDEDDRCCLVEWLAGVWCGRCGLIARVPQDRMLSRSVTLNKLDGKLLRGK
jgi:hypothetical protein